MNKVLSLMLSSLLLNFCLAGSASAVSISDINIPDSLTAGGSDLVLNGAGTRSKWFLDLYVGGLYLPARSSDASAIIEADEPQAIKLHIISGMITSDRMTSATMEGFENSTGDNVAPIKDEVDKFLNVFSEEIKEGDVFDLVYLPDSGVHVMKNGTERGVIKGMAFKKALFGIWLSDEPAQDSLKQSMLGGEK